MKMTTWAISEDTILNLDQVTDQMGTTPDALASKAIRRFLREEAEHKVRLEEQSFRAQHVTLLEQYAGRFVAMHDGQATRSGPAGQVAAGDGGTCTDRIQWRGLEPAFRPGAGMPAKGLFAARSQVALHRGNSSAGGLGGSAAVTDAVVADVVAGIDGGFAEEAHDAEGVAGVDGPGEGSDEVGFVGNS